MDKRGRVALYLFHYIHLLRIEVIFIGIKSESKKVELARLNYTNKRQFIVSTFLVSTFLYQSFQTKNYGCGNISPFL